MVTFDERCYGWLLELGKVDYKRVLSWQRGLVKMRREGLARDTIIFVEHPPVVTVGRNSNEENYKDLKTKPVFVERGGDVTYHGPGQLVVYFIFNLTPRGRDVHRFMADIRKGIIDALKEIGIDSEPGREHTGVWVGQRKIASIGVAIKHWITFHGAAINLNTRLSDFKKINPCGLQAEVMTSAKQILGRSVSVKKFSRQLHERYCQIFNTVFAPIALSELAEDIESQAGGYVL
ncbi:MAG: lipoyl(octanoyl) transferase LipB [Candidatus Zixiibacteriota bacterium]